MVVPNPVNVANAARVAELEERIKRCVQVLRLYLSSFSAGGDLWDGQQTNDRIVGFGKRKQSYSPCIRLLSPSHHNDRARDHR